MSDLIKALEEAEKGSRDLNIGLGQALGLIDEDLIYTSPDGSRSGRGNCDPWRDWTGSLDAALALAERVLPWACVGLAQLSPGNWQAWIGGRPAFAPAYSTAPLAMCIAILRASEQERGG